MEETEIEDILEGITGQICTQLSMNSPFKMAAIAENKKFLC